MAGEGVIMAVDVVTAGMSAEVMTTEVMAAEIMAMEMAEAAVAAAAVEVNFWVMHFRSGFTSVSSTFSIIFW